MNNTTEENKIEMVRVGCRQQNGLQLRLFRQGNDDGTGFKPQVADGLPVKLKGPDSHVAAGAGDPTGGAEFGTTEIPAAFWRAWVEQNRGKNPLLDGEVVFALDDEGRPAENG